MPRKGSSGLPKMGRHSSGQARVILNGRAEYLGPFGSLEAQKRYTELLERWEANGRQPLEPKPTANHVATLRELADKYLAHLDGTGRYRKDGEKTSMRVQIERTLHDFATSARGRMRADKLRGSTLRLHVDELLAKPHLTRTGVNRKLRILLQWLRWARERDLLSRDVWADVADVRPLKPGTCGTERERKVPKRAVSLEDAERAAAHALSPAIAAMIRVQAATGMRPGDVRKMRWQDLGPETVVEGVRCRLYKVASAKTAHHGHSTSYLLPEPVLELLGEQKLGGYVFPSPKIHGKPYCEYGYRDGVATACKLAGVPAFSPHELRHGFLSRACERYGVAVASQLANHRNVAVTARYVHPDVEKAQRAAIALVREGVA